MRINIFDLSPFDSSDIRSPAPSLHHRFRNLQGAAIIVPFLVGCSASGSEDPAEQVERLSISPISAEETTLSYLRAGDANSPQVVFVHGTPGSATAWTDYLENVPNNAEYIAIDRLGFGQSTRDREVVSLKDQAASILPLLATRNNHKPLLVGHSLGGPIIARLAVDHPDKIGGIVIVAGALDPGLEKINPLQYVGEWWPIVWILPKPIRNSNRELMALKGELEELRDMLVDLRVPVVIVHGTKDRLVPIENVPFMRQHFPEAVIRSEFIIDDGNHFLPWNAKDKIDQALALLSQ